MRKTLILLLLLSTFSLAREKYQKPGPVRLDRSGEKWAEKTLRKLSLEEKIGQMLMVRALAEFVNVESPDYLRLRDSIRQFHIGSVVLTVRVDGPFLLRNQPYEAAMLVNALQRDSELPLLVAADFERGPAMRLHGVTEFPAAMAFGAAGKTSYAEAFGRIVAQESRALGVHWNFSPVADVNSNPANPIINTRAFGEDPQQVGELAAAFIRAARENGMLTTAKHFPGHGDTDTDSHLALARVGGDKRRLETVELPPFRNAIAAGVDAVMVAHVTVPALEPDPNKVATISHNVVTTLLKEQLGFQGLVVTDAMDMRGLTRLFSAEGSGPYGASVDAAAAGRAAVAAVKAGNDMVLLPLDLEGAYNGLVQAVRSGELPPSTIDAAVRKILRAKASVGLHQARLVDVGALSTVVARPENVALGQEIAQAAVTLVKENGRILPLQRSGTAPRPPAYGTMDQSGHRLLAVVFSDDVRSENGRRFERELRARLPEANILFVDPRLATAMTEEVVEAAAKADAVVIAAYVTPMAGKTVKVGNRMVNTVSLEEPSDALLRRLLDSAREKTVMVALGSPYLAMSFPQVENYLCTFSNAPISEAAAVKALFGEIPIHGRLPVSLPGLAQRGSGLDRPVAVAAR